MFGAIGSGPLHRLHFVYERLRAAATRVRCHGNTSAGADTVHTERFEKIGELLSA